MPLVCSLSGFVIGAASVMSEWPQVQALVPPGLPSRESQALPAVRQIVKSPPATHPMLPPKVVMNALVPCPTSEPRERDRMTLVSHRSS